MNDLETYKLSTAPVGAQMWRGYFVRSGEGYHILTLPGFVYVHFGELADLDADTLTSLRRKAAVDVVAPGDCNYETHLDLQDATEALCRFIARETENEGIHYFAGKILAGCLAKAEATETATLRAPAFSSAPRSSSRRPSFRSSKQSSRPCTKSWR